MIEKLYNFLLILSIHISVNNNNMLIGVCIYFFIKKIANMY